MTLIQKRNKMRLLLFILLFSCMQSETNFSDKVLSNFDRYSSFIALDLNSKEYQGRVVIENDDLYYFFEQTQKIDRVQYKLKMI